MLGLDLGQPVEVVVGGVQGEGPQVEGPVSKLGRGLQYPPVGVVGSIQRVQYDACPGGRATRPDLWLGPT